MRHNILYWAMNLEDCEKYYLPNEEFNEEFHDAIKAFHKERIISALIHIYAQGENVYISPKNQQDDETIHTTNN